jgi:protein TonB
MSEIVATRAMRRKAPDADAWGAVSWSVGSVASGSVVSWRVVAASGVLAVALAGLVPRFFETESVAAAKDDPVWIEMPPPASEPVATIPPPLPTPPSEHPAPLPRAEPVPLRTVSDAAPDPDPAFGLDDAVETGGLAVAFGATLAKEPDPVVRAPEPPPGPVALGSVPASVRPVAPVYPPRAEERGLEARVVALVTTDTSGNVVRVAIERSGGRDFDESVRRAVLATRFSLPRGTDGRARAVMFRMPYDFRLE